MASNAIDKLREILGDNDEALALLERAEAEIRKDVAEDIIVDLKDFADEAPNGERVGWKGAIEMIKSNY